jgi:hypothetical protein
VSKVSSMSRDVPPREGESGSGWMINGKAALVELLHASPGQVVLQVEVERKWGDQDGDCHGRV